MRPIGLSARLSITQDVCWQCSRRLAAEFQARRSFTKTFLPRATASISPSPGVKAGYFSPNVLFDRFSVFQDKASAPKSVASATATAPSKDDREAISESGSTAVTQGLPHRRRQAARRAAAAASASASAAAAAAANFSTPTSPTDQTVLPQNASDILTNIAAAQPAHSLRRHLSALFSLSKPRLTMLVVLTAMAPYALYPVPAFLSPIAETPSLSPLTLLFLTTGTTLASASANALNMLYEPATDAKMSRTRNRPLVRNLLSTRAAMLFAVGCGIVGTALLYWGVNPTVAFLGAANILLYAGLYTPMKRLSWLNTWVGALVGGIPPLMGWAAAAGESATGDGTFQELLFKFSGDGTLSLGGWLLAGLLFAWQFPHFMALSWSIRDEYKNAGLRMLCWVDAARNARVALRYSLVFIPICVGLCAVGVTEWSFSVASLPVNAWLMREAWRFYKHEGHKGTARALFWASVWHLPAVMGLALMMKKGMWQRVWRGVMGEPVDEEEWEDIDDEVDVVPIPVPVPLPVNKQSAQGAKP